MITSTDNARVKMVRSLQTRRRVRQREKSLVFEGVRLVEEIAHAKVVPRFVLFGNLPTPSRREKQLLAIFRAQGVPCYEVSKQVMLTCSGTVTPQGLLAVIPFPDLAVPRHPRAILLIDQVRDPGNLGTMLRTAWAAGVELVLLSPGTVDPSSPKVVRSAMGAHLRLPVVAPGWDTIAQIISDSDVWLAAASGHVLYTSVDWVEPTTLIVGGEAAGASKEAVQLARGTISIPLAEEVESLNAATAAAIILFEAIRQRTHRP